jgi:hypothetical protein
MIMQVYSCCLSRANRRWGVALSGLCTPLIQLKYRDSPSSGIFGTHSADAAVIQAAVRNFPKDDMLYKADVYLLLILVEFMFAGESYYLFGCTEGKRATHGSHHETFINSYQLSNLSHGW